MVGSGEQVGVKAGISLGVLRFIVNACAEFSEILNLNLNPQQWSSTLGQPFWHRLPLHTHTKHPGTSIFKAAHDWKGRIGRGGRGNWGGG